MNILAAMGSDVRRGGENLREKLKKAVKRNNMEGIFNILLSEYLSTDQYQSLVDKAQSRYIIECS